MKSIVLLLGMLAFILPGCEDPMEEDPIEKDPIAEEKEEPEVEEEDSVETAPSCRLLSFDFEEEARSLTVEFEIVDNKITKSTQEYSNAEGGTVRIEQIATYEGVNLVGYEVVTYVDGEVNEETEGEEVYFVIDAEAGRINSISFIEKYYYDSMYYTYVSKEEFIYQEGLLVENVSSDGDEASETASPDENSVTMSVSEKNYYSYDDSKNLTEKESFNNYSQVNQRSSVERSRTYRMLDEMYSLMSSTYQAKSGNTGVITNYTYDEKGNPFSELDKSYLLILNSFGYGNIFGPGQLLSTNNLLSASSTETGPVDNPYTQVVNVDYTNTYDERDFLKSVDKFYRSVYTSDDFEDIIEIEESYVFNYSCE